MRSDLDRLDELVSVAVVVDPFSPLKVEDLRLCFQDVTVPFKQHLIADLKLTTDKVVSPHHKYYAQKALRLMEIDVTDPSLLLDEWCRLYGHLLAKRSVHTHARFSREAFALQLNVPGIVALCARHQGEIIGAHLWYVMGNVAYSHLAATSELGYKLGAAYALHYYAIEYFRGRVDWLNWGAAAGLEDNSSDGLARFKRGWATGTRTAYLCGRIFDRKRYDELTAQRGVTSTSYFPAYRQGEFASASGQNLPAAPPLAA